jgi:hypothetical protein
MRCRLAREGDILLTNKIKTYKKTKLIYVGFSKYELIAFGHHYYNIWRELVIVNSCFRYKKSELNESVGVKRIVYHGKVEYFSGK